jgi:acyl-CoA reductase-like NAD-dependent aldehyde dehydrogenase
VALNVRNGPFLEIPRYGQSGIGREMGASALDSYTEVKSVWIDTGNKIQFRTGRAEDSDGL